MTARPPPSPLRVTGCDLAQARRIVVTVPGTLTRLSIFDPLTERLPAGTSVVALPFPGLDGRALDRPVRIRATARAIAARIADSPARRIDLVGYSAGGAICMELRGLLPNRNVTTAIIAGAVPAPALIVTGLRFGVDILRLARKNPGASRTELWFDVFQILLFGRNPQHPEVILDGAARPPGPSVTPTPRMIAYHGLPVAFWRPSRRARRATTPLRFFHGANDPVCPPNIIARLAMQLTQADVVWYRDRGHLPHLFNPVLYDDIRSFWQLRRAD